ncbi:hypothetical protein BBW65_02870 [Helicobacter enhydrae]|uniref:4'-phosphopantetheinyl transferase domain-containing protein n=1 Tax=Helicobacter enhydrae TaxID=222136 RepID=A0A1B1U4Y1_9HELI|nr:holo-ACP synthase [Helicobacter enhydrae]ANV97809.1 hypothetical protein BBW65_02870 [Helicobacter enhydrae]
MIGIDVVGIERIRKVCERFPQKFVPYFLSEAEQKLCQSGGVWNHQRIAGFWAIKEAVSKALGVGISQELGFLDICITKDARGRPIVCLTEEKCKAFAISRIDVSVTHDCGVSIAVAHIF